ncbi:MAG: hypothetical protein ACRDTX_12875 [Pseudonocardiaceae bacterium]
MDEDNAEAQRWVSCEIPGCAHRMPYSGRGAPPKYCGQTVEGLRHTRLTAHRLSKGHITVPPTGSATGVSGDPERGEIDGDARPVTVARMTLELLLAEVAEQVAGHEQRMAVLAGQITAAARAAADRDDAAAEVAAAHRAARADIDAAEAERDQALRVARQATRTSEESQQRATVAEIAAEEALAELEAAEHVRDQALGERDELAVTVAHAREERESALTRVQTLQAEASRAREHLAEAAASRAELIDQLTAQRERADEQRQRAQAAEQQAAQATSHIEHLSHELTTARGQVEHWQAQASEHRAELAAAHATIDAERHHTAQRLADQQTRYDELIVTLRTQLPEPGQPQQRPLPRRQAAAKKTADPEARRVSQGGRTALHPPLPG